MLEQIRHAARRVINWLRPRAAPSITPSPKDLLLPSDKERLITLIHVGTEESQREKPQGPEAEEIARPQQPSAPIKAEALLPKTKLEPAAGKAEPSLKTKGVDAEVAPVPFQTATHLVDSIRAKAEDRLQLELNNRYRRPTFAESPVKHPIANYYDEKGSLAEASYKDLKDETFLRYVYSHNIGFFDDKGRRLQIRLFESGARRPHFWLAPEAKPARKTRTFDNTPANRETDPTHEKRIEYFLRETSKTNPFHVFTIDWGKGQQSDNGKKRDIVDAERFVLGDIGGYSWKKNTQQYSLSLGNVRPDIIGKPQTSKSDQHPSIIVEVINTHFPSEPTWEAYLQHTIEKPLLVLFDFTEKWNYFLQACPRDDKNGAATIRTVYYLWKGFLWHNTTPFEQRPSSQNFKKLVDLSIRDLNKKENKQASKPYQSQRRNLG